MNSEIYNEYVNILREELVPALGCTEPIAIAYCASLASSLLPSVPERMDIYVSANIIKNVKSVVVPNTKGEKGIPVAAAAGVIAATPEKELEILSGLDDSDIAAVKEYLTSHPVRVFPSTGDAVFSITVEAYLNGHKALCEIRDNHTNVVLLELDGKVIREKKIEESGNTEKKDRKSLTISGIVDFAESVKIEDVSETLERQIRYNMAIAEEGLNNSWGANIGSILLSSYGNSVHNRAKAYAAAGSDARMNGCERPVIINSGSGNQGLTVSIPVIIYAENMHIERELLLRALCVSNLVAIHIKAEIGSLSAFCGATSAACGAAAGISYLYGGREKEISHAVVNSLAIVSGMICDGAKASCAAKIASAVEAGLIGFEMTRNNSEFVSGDGIVTKGVENTIRNIVRLATVGMRETDRTIIGIMTEKCK